MSVSTRRAIVLASIVLDAAVLIAVAIGAQVTRPSPAATLVAMAIPVVSMLCGLLYLRSTRGRQ
jgi:hypothetical protein